MMMMTCDLISQGTDCMANNDDDDNDDDWTSWATGCMTNEDLEPISATDFPIVPNHTSYRAPSTD